MVPAVFQFTAVSIEISFCISKVKLLEVLMYNIANDLIIFFAHNHRPVIIT